jgi:RHS repeat-associated protein
LRIAQRYDDTATLVKETHYIYDGMRVIQERDENNTPTVSYTRGTDVSGTMEGAGGIGGLLARTDGNGSAFYHADGNGNVTALVNGSQTLVASYRYDPFGKTNSSSGTLANANVYRFSSKEIHANSGMYYYGYRFYDPILQRWLNWDPLQEDSGINLYRFGLHNPNLYVDALGLAILQNGTDVPIIVGGGAGPGEGHNPGNMVFVVLPPGGTIGAPNPMPGYPTPEDAMSAYKNPGSVASTGTLYDADFWNSPCGGRQRVRGDDKGPHYVITKSRNRTGGDSYNAGSDPTDWPGAIKRYFKR